MTIEQIKDPSKQEAGKFAKRLFVVCKNNDELYIALTGFSESGHKHSVVDIDGYEIEKKGVIVYLSQTLMQWGHIKIISNSLLRRNSLRNKGYQQII